MTFKRRVEKEVLKIFREVKQDLTEDEIELIHVFLNYIYNFGLYVEDVEYKARFEVFRKVNSYRIGPSYKE